MEPPRVHFQFCVSGFLRSSLLQLIPLHLEPSLHKECRLAKSNIYVQHDCYHIALHVIT